MSIVDVYQLKIIIKTKIPNHTSLELTSDLLIHKLDKSKTKLLKYPLFSTSILYPRNKLQNSEYEDVIMFFFNEDRFEKTLKKTKKNITKKMNPKKKQKNVFKNIDIALIPDTRKNQNPANQMNETEIKYHNFTLMLQLLFPTYFPSVNNIETSLSYVLKNKPDIIPFQKNKTNQKIGNFFSFKGSNTFFPFFEKYKRKFSYLKIDNIEYTITHVIWINDVMNHPIYKEILMKYYAYEEWKNNKFLKKQETVNKDARINIIKIINQNLTNAKKKGKEEEIKFEHMDSRYIDGNNNRSEYYSEPKREDKNTRQVLYDRYNSKIDLLKKTLGEQPNGVFNIDNDATNKMIINDFNECYTVFKKVNNQTYFKEYKFINTIGQKIYSYMIDMDIQDFILELNFNYLNESPDNESDSKQKEYKNRIPKFYIEFNNFVKTIKNMQNRIIDNPVWNSTITKIITGDTDSNFKELWDEINLCYSIIDVEKQDQAKIKEDLEKKEKEERLVKLKNKQNEKPEKAANAENDKNAEKKAANAKKQNGGININTCTNSKDELTIGFDVLISNNPNNPNPDAAAAATADAISGYKTIEIYLQMDIIEGKIDETNMHLLKCPYNDLVLGNMYDLLLYNPSEQWNVGQQLIFYSAKELLNNNKKNNNKKNKNPPLPDAPEEPLAKAPKPPLPEERAPKPPLPEAEAPIRKK